MLVSGCLGSNNQNPSTKPAPEHFQMPVSIPVDNITVGDRGYLWEISGTDTPLDGVSVDFPEGALVDETRVSIGYSIDKNVVPHGTTAVSPQVHLNASVTREFSNLVTLTIPYSKQKQDNRVVALCFDEELQKWDAAGLAEHDYANKRISVHTVHFSMFGLFELAQSALDFTGSFKPAIDGWDIGNTGSYLTEGGNCLGMSSFAKWYFQQKGGSLASAYEPLVEPLVATRAHLAESQVWAILQFIKTGLLSSETSTGIEIAALMKITGLPQIVLLGESGSPKHAVLAFGFKGDHFQIYDPNHPGIERQIHFTVADGFGDYGTYDTFGYYGLSALGVASKFSNIDKDARNGFFGSNDISITSPVAGKEYKEETVMVGGSVKDRVADATHVAIYVGADAFGTTISNRQFSMEVPLNMIGKIDILVLAGQENPVSSSESAVARISISHDTGVVLLVTMTWEEDDMDVDLYVTEPDGETIWYRNMQAGTGGCLDVDNTHGYGPEHYTLDVAENDTVEQGNYVINVHYYYDHSTSQTAHCTVSTINYYNKEKPVISLTKFVIEDGNKDNATPGSTGPDWHYITSLALIT